MSEPRKFSKFSFLKMITKPQAAYERLCAMGARMEDVATHIGGKVWESKITHTRFEEVDDTPLLPGR